MEEFLWDLSGMGARHTHSFKKVCEECREQSSFRVTEAEYVESIGMNSGTDMKHNVIL